MVLLPVIMCAAAALSVRAIADDLPQDAQRAESFSSSGVVVFERGTTLWLQLKAEAIAERRAILPRLCAPIRSWRWRNDSDAELKFVPEPTNWVFSWKQPVAEGSVIEVEFDSVPKLPQDCPAATSVGDGSVLLHASQAATFGEKLRYEPQWFKNTVGYWTVPTDYAAWDLQIDQPGQFTVAILQGCGTGQGGSDAALTLRQGDGVTAELPFQTVDTGHFQNFRWLHLGTITVEDSGTYQLRIIPVRIAKAALCDIRMVHLVRQAR